MKLYFYSVSFLRKKDKWGIVAQECEAVEKPKTYQSIEPHFPTFQSRISKSDIGEIISNDIIDYIVLTEPNFEYAKSKFKEMAERMVSDARETLKRREEELKIIEESEE